MFDAKFWNEIKEKYPKGLKIFCDSFDIYHFDVCDNMDCSCGQKSIICYCDIEKFF